MFNRTETGLINKYLFYPEPIIWVEGSDDFPFYMPILERLECRIESAGGKPECRKLADALVEKDYPFVVILDGDYDILENKTSPHQRVLILDKYAIENYLFERRLVQSVCSKYLGTEERGAEIGELFDQLESDIRNNLYDLVILDILNYRMGTGREIFPDHADSVINIRTAHCIPERIQSIYTAIMKDFQSDAITNLRDIVDAFLTGRRFSDLVRGHFIFGIVRHFVIGCVKKMKGQKPNLDNDSLLIMLSLEIWNIIPSDSHTRLIEDLTQAVESARELRSIVD